MSRSSDLDFLCFCLGEYSVSHTDLDRHHDDRESFLSGAIVAVAAIQKT